jgi:hypothetical protein
MVKHNQTISPSIFSTGKTLNIFLLKDRRDTKRNKKMERKKQNIVNTFLKHTHQTTLAYSIGLLKQKLEPLFLGTLERFYNIGRIWQNTVAYLASDKQSSFFVNSIKDNWVNERYKEASNKRFLTGCM